MSSLLPKVGKVRRQVLQVLIFSLRLFLFWSFSSGMSLLLHLEGAISSSGSKKGQVKMGAAAGFFV